MSKLPSLTGREVITALSKAGFEVVRVRGSQPLRVRQKSLIQKSKVRTP